MGTVAFTKRIRATEIIMGRDEDIKFVPASAVKIANASDLDGIEDPYIVSFEWGDKTGWGDKRTDRIELTYALEECINRFRSDYPKFRDSVSSRFGNGNSSFIVPKEMLNQMQKYFHGSTRTPANEN